MAPPKPVTQRTREAACKNLIQLLKSREQPVADEKILEHLNVVKGLFNRVVREDQWDWFRVVGQLGYPSRRLAQVVACKISNLSQLSAIRTK